MPGINIIFDTQHLLADQEASFAIDLIQDYLHACLEMRRHLQNKEAPDQLTVRVHSPVVEVWVRAFAQV